MPKTSLTSIDFAQVPNDLEVPGSFMEFSSANANNGAAAMPYVLLIMGQMLPTGTATATVPVRITNGKAQADQLFGQGSMLSTMVAAAVKVNSWTETWAVGVPDNAAGVAGAGSIAFTGTATAAGTLTAYIGYSGLIQPAQIAVNIGDTAATVATNLAAAIAEVADLPVTAAVDGTTPSKVDITARHKGQDAGNIDIRLVYYDTDLVPPGLTATVTAMTGGATNPDQSTLISALGDTQYHVIACPWTDAATYSAWLTEMQRRWNALVYKEGAMVQALRGTPGTLGTQLAAMNSQFLDSYCSQNTPTAPFVEAAMIAAAYAFNLAQRPNAPQKGTPLPGLMPPVQADRFILSERNTLYLEGGSSWIVEKDGTVVLERAVTTYKTNASGTPDTSYHGRWTMATLMYLRYSWVNWMNAKFPNFTLADDGTPVVAGEVTPAILGRETFAWYKAMQKLGLVQDAKGFYAALVSIRDLQNVSRNDQLMAPRLVPPLDIIAGQMAFVE